MVGKPHDRHGSPAVAFCGAKSEGGQSLSRSYGRFIAEFLNASSLVRLGLLDHPTGVGLRYGLEELSKRRFSWKLNESDSPAVRQVIGIGTQLNPGISLRVSTLCTFHVQSIERSGHPSPSRRF